MSFDVQLARIVGLLLTIAVVSLVQLGVTVWTLTHVRTPKPVNGPVR